MKRPFALVLALGFVLATGCGKEMFEGSDANMRQWFKWGTELELPAEARYLSGRNYSSWLSDIRMKIRVPPDFKKTLDECLARDDDARSNLQPPDDVLADQPKWGEEGPDRLSCYTHTTGNADDGGFITTLGLDEESGVMYCVISEYAP